MISAIRLRGHDNPFSGRLEILYEGWRVVCNNGYWRQNEMDVACRQMGFPGGVKILQEDDTGTEKMKTFSRNFICQGTERYLSICTRAKWERGSWCGSNYVGIICQRSKFKS